jgi:excisionase family DNA binding protein
MTPCHTEAFSLISCLEMQKTLLDVEEVSQLLNLSKFTVYRMAKAGQLPSLILGGSRRFDPATLAYFFRKKSPAMAAAARAMAAA